AAGIPTWSPTVVLICRSTAYVWQSGRDAQFSADCGLFPRAFAHQLAKVAAHPTFGFPRAEIPFSYLHR
ncbi:hypothetical protein KCU98_g7279, partial [Aureobasidium melanogenum]